MAAISFEAVSNVGTRFHAQRINRRLDDRDAVLKEALAQLEEKDHSKFPTVEKVTSINTSATAGNDLCVCTGANFSTAVADYAIRVAGVAASVKAGPTATSFTIVMPTPAVSGSAGDQWLVQVRISGVLCTEFFLTVA
jgi:hypothetical protein